VGYVSLVAPWAGGAAAPVNANAGYRSLVAPWLGGASAPVSTGPGYRSLVAPWLGGASALLYVPPVTPISGGIGRPDTRRARRIKVPDDFTAEHEDELLTMILVSLAAITGSNQ
jgi:hypothetical protein